MTCVLLAMPVSSVSPCPLITYPCQFVIIPQIFYLELLKTARQRSLVEQVYRSAFLNTGVFNGFKASFQLFSNYFRIPPTRFAQLPVDSNCLHACLKVIHQCTLQRKRPPIRMSKVSRFSTIIYMIVFKEDLHSFKIVIQRIDCAVIKPLEYVCIGIKCCVNICVSEPGLQNDRRNA